MVLQCRRVPEEVLIDFVVGDVVFHRGRAPVSFFCCEASLMFVRKARTLSSWRRKMKRARREISTESWSSVSKNLALQNKEAHLLMTCLASAQALVDEEAHSLFQTLALMTKPFRSLTIDLVS